MAMKVFFPFVLAALTAAHDDCDFRLTQEQASDLAAWEEARKKRAPRNAARQVPSCDQCETIEVAFHILGNAAGDSKAAVLWTDESIRGQVESINSQWVGTPFRFVHRATTRSFRDDWAYSSYLDTFYVDQYATELRVGGRKTLNVFVNDGTCSLTSGYSNIAYTNKDLWPDDEFTRADRIHLCAETVWTGNNDNYLLTHEIGHMLGLYHPYEGEVCDPRSPGDYVADTPSQKDVTTGSICDPEKDSCPDIPGLDNIYNFMDFGSCTPKSFTAGQIERMDDLFTEFRALAVPCDNDEATIEIEIQCGPNGVDKIQEWQWGRAQASILNPMVTYEPVTYANKKTHYRWCLPRNTMEEFQIHANGGLQPGYFAFKLNGKEVVRRSQWDGAFASILLSGDNEVCGPGEGRFRLELAFDGRSVDTRWDIKDATGSVVVDQRATTAYQQVAYYPNWNLQTLFFDQCLKPGPYTFNIVDLNNDGIVPPGYYKLYISDELVYELPIDNALRFKSSESIRFQVAARPVPSPTRAPVPSPTQAPVPAPTQAPVPAPTQAPVPAPTQAPSTNGFCFSGSSTMQMMNEERKQLKDIRVGDIVHVGGGIYEPIYAFGHFSPSKVAEVLQISTEKADLQLTKDHMVFLSTNKAVPAARLKAGDRVLSDTGDEVVVKGVQLVSVVGMFAPFTPSGRVSVDGILVSCYISFENNLSFFGIEISQQWLGQSFKFPHRLACHYFGRCYDASFNDHGISSWDAAPLQAGLWLLRQDPATKTFLGLLFIATLVVFNFIESCVVNPVLTVGFLYAISKLATFQRFRNKM